jgi:hypothetical protein
MFIPDPDLDFLPIRGPEVRKAPDPGSATLQDILFLFYYFLLTCSSSTEFLLEVSRSERDSSLSALLNRK